MKMYKYILTLLLFWAVGTTVPVLAQSTAEETTTSSSTPLQSNANVEMADVMRQDGKIYIVVAVLVSILLGVLFYLISLDKKVSRLEKEFRQ